MRTLAAAALLLAAAFPSGAVELSRVSSPQDGINHALMIPKEEAQAIIADTTMLASLSLIDDAALKEKLPFGTDAVLYFAENGDLLAWSDKSGVVEAGYWEFMANSGYNELCVRFGRFGLDSICIEPRDGGGPYWLTQRTNGNPFGLVAGAAVPRTLGAGTLDLSTIAASFP
jgi:hypothetical protein